MPELPEVETVKNSLKLKLIGRCIVDVRVYYDNIIEYPSVLEFKKNIVGKRINDIGRYGKWLIFYFDDYCLLSHLRMEGKYFFRKKGEKLYLHEHVAFLLDNEMELRYMDVRKFGKMLLIKKDDIYKTGPFVLMGLEPWDKNLNVSYLREKYKNRRLPIKSMLLDQSVIVEIGNIYADEILFLSGINPLKKASFLDDKELENIIFYTRDVLEKAIKKGGTTIRSYTSVDGVHGLFQQELFVHGKDRGKCSNCGSDILKIKVGGRGTYYCSVCQRDGLV